MERSEDYGLVKIFGSPIEYIMDIGDQLVYRLSGRQGEMPVPKDFTCIFDPEIARRTTSGMCNLQDKIFFFCDEAHRRQCFKKWGFNQDWINSHFLPVSIEKEKEMVA